MLPHPRLVRVPKGASVSTVWTRLKVLTGLYGQLSIRAYFALLLVLPARYRGPLSGSCLYFYHELDRQHVLSYYTTAWSRYVTGSCVIRPKANSRLPQLLDTTTGAPTMYASLSEVRNMSHHESQINVSSLYKLF